MDPKLVEGVTMPNDLNELLDQLPTGSLVRSRHDSLSLGWDHFEGVEDLLRALGGKHDDQRKIAEVGLQVISMLLSKNRQYGNSALDPIRVFGANLTVRDKISVRLDDKLSRIARGSGEGDEDARFDIIGYLILDRIAEDEERV